MALKKNKPKKRLLTRISFEEIDHRLSCGWHVDIETNAFRKKLKPLIKGSREYELKDQA